MAVAKARWPGRGLGLQVVSACVVPSLPLMLSFPCCHPGVSLPWQEVLWALQHRLMPRWALVVVVAAAAAAVCVKLLRVVLPWSPPGLSVAAQRDPPRLTRAGVHGENHLR